MKKTETFIRSLIEEPVDLDRLEVEIAKLRPKFASFDPELVSQLQSKYNDGREFQTNCVTIIQSAQENEFTQEGIKVIDQLMKDAKKLNLDFPELRRLETVRLIPKWVAKIHGIIIEGAKIASGASAKEAKLKKVKPLRIMRQEAIKGLDALEPQKIKTDMKDALIEALSKDVPEVLDQELYKLLRKIQLILWIKDAFDLIGKEAIAIADLVSLKDTPAQDDSQFQHLKFKYLTFHKQISELFNQQESWMHKANQLESKLTLDENAIEGARLEQLRKGFEALKKIMNPNITKIIEVKAKFEHLTALLNRIQWGLDCQEYLKPDESGRKKLEDLESLYRRAEECKVPHTWTMFASIETLFTQVKDLVLKTKKLIGNSQSKMEIEEPAAAASTKSAGSSSPIEIMDYEKKSEAMKSKITMDELDQALVKMKELNTKVDFDSQIEFLEASNKNQEKYIQTITRCYNAHQNAMENYKETPNEDLLSIRSQINDIAKLESTILVALPKFDQYFLKLHWSIDCAFFLSSSLTIKMKKDIDACRKLVYAQKVIKDIENNKLFQSLNEQLNTYNKCNDAVELLKKDEKKKKPEERATLITTKNFRELESALRSVTIEDSQVLFKYVQKLKRKMESTIEEYDEAMRSFTKLPMKFWKDLLEKFHSSKIPVKCDEECMLEIMIQTAEEMEVALKGLKRVGSPAPTKKRTSAAAAAAASAASAAANSQAIEILERYRLQQVKLPEAEKLLEKIKLKEDALSIIEKKLYSTAGEQLSYTETLKIAQEVQALQSEFKGERMERLKQELFLKKILVLQDLWENNGQTEGTLFSQMKDLKSEAKNKFEKRVEPRFALGLQFLSELVEKCAERVKQIEAISNIKELETILKEEADKVGGSLRFCGFVDMSNEIIERISLLKSQQEAARKKEQEKRQREKEANKEKLQRIEEEKKLRLQNDPRAQKKHEAEEKLQERLTNNKRNATQFKQAMISDVAKSINNTYPNINLQDCIVYGTSIVERSLIENSSQMTPTSDQIGSICKLLETLKKHVHLCAGLKKSKFEWTEILRLVKLSQTTTVRGYKDALEKEEKMVQVTHTIKQSESNSLVMHDVKFRRKEEYQMTPVVPLESAGGTTNASPVHSQTNQSQQTVVPQKKQTKLPSFLPQIDLLFNGLGGSKKDEVDSSFVNIDDNNITKQSVAKIREGKLSMAKLGLISNNTTSNNNNNNTTSTSTASQKPKRFGAKFSDDEDDDEGVNEYVPLREEDFQTLNESLSLSAQKRRPEITMGQFDPDAETVSQKTDEAGESAQVVSMLSGALQIVVDSNDPNIEPQMISINRVFVLSSEDVKECMMMPQCPPAKCTMVVKGVLSLSNFTQYHASLISEKQLNPERKIRVLGGWFETELNNDHSELQAYANYLKMRNRVAVIEWTPECKLYAMHRDQWNNNGNENQTIKFKRNFFHNSANPNDTLLFLMIFKQYKLYPDQNTHYENVRPIFMQKRVHPANESTSSKSHNSTATLLAAAANAAAAQAAHHNAHASNTAPHSTNKVSVADNKASVAGKKSFGKMSALEALTFESDEEDVEEERRLNDRVLAIKNQFARGVASASNMDHSRATPSNDRFARIGHYVNTFPNNNPSRYNNTNQKPMNATSYPRSANRSGVSTPNYYDQQGFPQDQLNDALSRHLGSQQKPMYQRTLNFKTNESMEIEPEQYPSFSRSNMMQQQQQYGNQQQYYNNNNPRYNSQQNNNNMMMMQQQQQQQMNNSFNNNLLSKNYNNNNSNNVMMNKRTPHQYMNNNNNKLPINTPNSNYPYNKMNNNNMNNEEDINLTQDPNRIGSILSTLDQTLRELIKSQKTKEQTPSEYLISTLLQQQQQQQALQQQQKLIQQLSKQTTNAKAAAVAAAAADALLGDKKKKQMRKRRKRPSVTGLNQSIDGESSMSDDESQESYQHQQRPMSVVQSHYQQQQIGQTARNNSLLNMNANINNPNNPNYYGGKQSVAALNNAQQQSQQQQQQQQQQPAQNRNTPYLNALNNKKQMKIFDKQAQKMNQQLDQQQQQPTRSTSTAAGSSQYTQQQSSHFARNQAAQQVHQVQHHHQQQQQVHQVQQVQQVPQAVSQELLLVDNNNILLQQTQQAILQHQQQQQLQQQQVQPAARSITATPAPTQGISQATTPGATATSTSMVAGTTSVKPTIQFTTSLPTSLPVPNPQQSSLTALNSLHHLMKLNPNNNNHHSSHAGVGIASAQQPTLARPQNNPQTQRAASNLQQGQFNNQNRSLSRGHQSNSNNNFRNNNNNNRQHDQDPQHHSRPLLTDLSKSGRINQERTHTFQNIRGEVKEGNNPSEIPRYMKEKSVRNPTFYQSKQPETTTQQQSVAQVQQQVESEVVRAVGAAVSITTNNVAATGLINSQNTNSSSSSTAIGTRVTSVPTTPQPSNNNNGINPNNSNHSNHSNNNSVLLNRKSNFSYSSVNSRDVSLETSFDKENGLKTANKV